MRSFEWDNKYLTGLMDVDEQHHKLVNMLNEFGDLLAENEVNKSDIDRLLVNLADYAQYHFQDEEKLMLASGIDDRHVKYHKNEHDLFMQQVHTMCAGLGSSPKNGASQLLEFLINWLAYHILGVDQNMARQLAAIKSGTSAEAAYLVEEKNRAESTAPLLAALTGLFQQLSERNQALLEINKTLEARVQERTQALMEANYQLEKIAMTDVLTELPNRRYAMAMLNQFWGESAALGCMMIDADGFKQINDHYGHESGDIVLQALARELKHKVRTDDIVCRLGGDEFLILCTDTPLQGMMHLATQVRKAVNALRVHAGVGIWTGSISVGVAVRTNEMGSPDLLLKAADDGVYMAKHDGRNCVRTIQA